jgi:hypothetical protein
MGAALQRIVPDIHAARADWLVSMITECLDAPMPEAE